MREIHHGGGALQLSSTFVVSPAMHRQFVVATVATIAVALVVRIVPPARRVRLTGREEPGPTCELPPHSCADLSASRQVRAGFCDELVHMPHEGVGFRNRRLPGERTAATSPSYLRRDLAMAVAYAAARVACKAAGLRPGNREPIVLGDMSERDGEIPGTLERLPRHPLETHLGGREIDIGG